MLLGSSLEQACWNIRRAPADNPNFAAVHKKCRRSWLNSMFTPWHSHTSVSTLMRCLESVVQHTNPIIISPINYKYQGNGPNTPTIFTKKPVVINPTEITPTAIYSNIRHRRSQSNRSMQRVSMSIPSSVRFHLLNSRCT